MRDALRQRTVIIGNSGSGKSTLARALAARLGSRTIDLDPLHWEDGHVGKKRDEAAACQLLLAQAAEPRWIIEGVYGWLAAAAVPRATALIWLDLPWSVCRAGLFERGPWRGVDDVGFAEFLAWAEAYWGRPTSTSFDGHLRLFEDFAGAKARLQSRTEVAEFLARLNGVSR